MMIANQQISNYVVMFQHVVTQCVTTLQIYRLLPKPEPAVGMETRFFDSTSDFGGLERRGALMFDEVACVSAGRFLPSLNPANELFLREAFGIGEACDCPKGVFFSIS